MELGIQGRTALVTGASMGIGRGIATALAREGVKLAVVARRRNLLEELQKEIGRLVIIECDLLSEGSVEKIAAAALEGLGSVDILVNNAGGSRRFTLESSEAQWEEALTLNFTRQRQLAHRLLPQMMARKWGRIDSEQIRRNYSPERRAKEEREDIPLGEYGQPADIANLVCFLVSPLARYITGTVIAVDGGMRRYQF